MSELVLVRHGQASFGADNYDQLSPLGHQQAQLLGQHFSSQQLVFDHVLKGSMYRHEQTLDSIFLGMTSDGLSREYLTHSGLNEYDFVAMVRAFSLDYPNDELYLETLKNPGDKKVYYKLLRRVLAVWGEGLLKNVPETWAEFQQRVMDARVLIHSLAEQGSRILAVSSGGAISTFIGSVLGLSTEKIFDLNLQTYNTSVSRFYFNTEKINLACFNEMPHFLQSPESITYG